jgi:hypothetical protein
MNNDLLNILSNSNKDIDNQKLMDYLAGKLSEQERHEVEKWMIDNEFASEAVEGLQHFSGKKNLEGYVDQLNKELNKYIQQKKDRRRKKKDQGISLDLYCYCIHPHHCDSSLHRH